MWGYYKLKGGESLKNLATCPCGGNLNYYEYFGSKNGDDEKEELLKEIKELKEEVRKVRKKSEEEKPSDMLSSIILAIIVILFVFPLISLLIVGGFAFIYQNYWILVVFLIIFGVLAYSNYKKKRIEIKNNLLFAALITLIIVVTYYVIIWLN